MSKTGLVCRLRGVLETKKRKNVNIIFFFHFTELAQLTGVAAILRFPMPELEDSENEEEDSDSD